LTIDLSQYTVLVGRNGTGKSTFLAALDFFFTPNYQITDFDFYGKEVGEDISVTVTFASLTAEELVEFQKYVRDGKLSIEKIARVQDGAKLQSYHGSCPQHEPFAHIRAVRGRDLITAYGVMRQAEGYSDLPAARSEETARVALNEWEVRHPEQCVPARDDGQFFGFTNVGAGKLARRVSFVRIPAVMAMEELYREGASNPLRVLVDALVRERGGARAALTDLRERVETEYEELLRQPAFDLAPAAEAITHSLADFVPGVEVKLEWAKASAVKWPEPVACVNFNEAGFTTPPQYKGHGLLRAYELSVIGLLSERIRTVGQDEPERTLEAIPKPFPGWRV
jgi:hypothetical protein